MSDHVKVGDRVVVLASRHHPSCPFTGLRGSVLALTRGALGGYFADVLLPDGTELNLSSSRLSRDS